MGRRGPKTDPAKALVRGTYRESRHGVADAGQAAEPEVVVPRDYVGQAAAYCAEVSSGSRVACLYLRQAVARQLRDLKRARTDPAWPYEWDVDQANAICYFAERLPHIEGRWKTSLISLEPVQCFILTTLFGWRRKEGGGRRFQIAYVEVARKFGKSVLASIVALYCLTREQEPGAQVKCAATTNSQARIVFNVARRMVLKSAWLREEEGLEVLANAIVHDESGSSIQPINSKSSTQDGLNPHCTIIDELHAHKDRSLFDVLRSAQGARSNPLSFYITTAGYNLLGVAYEQRSLLIKTLQQVFELDHYFGVIFTIDEGDDPFDEAVWGKANPMLGVTPTLEGMRQYAKEAKLSPSSAGEFKTKRCNLWLQSASAWLDMGAVDACADPKLSLEDFLNEVCWMGVDLSQVDDLTAKALVFARGDLLYAFVTFYLPELVVDERARHVPAYREWADSGLLVPTDGNMVDYDKVESDIEADFKRFKVQKIWFDQYGSAQIGSRLIARKMPAELMPKNAKTFTQPSRELEARIKHGRFRFDGNICLRWQFSNVVVTRRIDGTILPKKEQPESPNKIDGVDAILQGIGAMLASPAKKTFAKSFLA